MKTFDYARAWADVSVPAFQSLDESIRALLALVDAKAGALHQLPDTSMPWPNDGDELRAAFDRVPAPDLAFAAQVIYTMGHWHPNPKVLGVGPLANLIPQGSGAHWKFSHYADQALRARLGLNPSGRDSSLHSRGWSRAIHQGEIRICYSSKNMWTWIAAAPADEAGIERANQVLSDFSRATDDDAAYRVMEDYRLLATADAWPERWRPFVNIAERYMVDEKGAR